MGIAVRDHRCGRRWNAANGRRLSCQREPGHGGAHLSDLQVDGRTVRHWFVPVTGDRGVNRYRGDRAGRPLDGAGSGVNATGAHSTRKSRPSPGSSRTDTRPAAVG